MLKFLGLNVTRHRIAFRLLDLRERPKVGCSTGDEISVCYAFQVRWKSATSRPKAATSCGEIVNDGTRGRSLKTDDTVKLNDEDFLRITGIPE